MTPESKSIGAVLETLEQAAQTSGHVYLSHYQLIHALGELVDFTQAQAMEAIRLAAERGHVVVRGARVYLRHLEEAERAIERDIGAFLQKQNGG